MKKIKNATIIAIILAVVLIFCGCSAIVETFENKELRNHTDVMLNAILMNDSQAAYSLVSDICSQSDFQPTFDKMCNLLKDIESYDLKLVSINQKSNLINGESIKTIDSVYEMETDKGKFVVSVQSSSQTEKLSAFYITPYEKTNMYYTGVIQNMKDASFLQWIMLLSNLVVIALIVIAFVDCCRHKIKLKPLWLILIIIGALSLSLTVSAKGINFNFNLIWFTAYTALMRYGSGDVTIRFVIPLGVVLYFILRHKLIKKPVPNEPVQSEEIQTAE